MYILIYIYIAVFTLWFSTDKYNFNCFGFQMAHICTTLIAQDLLVIVSKLRANYVLVYYINNLFIYYIVDDGKFKFLPDTIYVYQNSISTQTTFDKSKNTASIAEFNFKVHIHIKDCDGSMFVSMILHFKTNISKNVLIFKNGFQ